jgi:hypothetical protein
MNTTTANHVDYLPENFIVTEELKKNPPSGKLLTFAFENLRDKRW